MRYLLALLLLIAAEAKGVMVNVSWDHPRDRVDGSVLRIDEIALTEIVWSCPAGSGEIAVIAPSSSVDINIDYIGGCTFKARTEDIAGIFGDWSEAKVVEIINRSPPSPPTWIEIIMAFFKQLFGWFA